MNPGVLAVDSLLPNAIHANVSIAKRASRTCSACSEFRRGRGACSWVWALVCPHLAQLWLVRAQSWFPGGGHRTADRNPAYSLAGDLYISGFLGYIRMFQLQLRGDGEGPCAVAVMLMVYSGECLSDNKAHLEVFFH